MIDEVWRVRLQKLKIAKIFANVWLAKNWQIFEFAQVRPGPLILNFKWIQIY